MPTVAVKKIPQVFDLGFQGPQIPIRSSLLTGLAQQILGGLLQNIGLSSFIFSRSKVISFCQVMLLSSNDDVRRQMNHSFFAPRFKAPQTREITTPGPLSLNSPSPANILGNLVFQFP